MRAEFETACAHVPEIVELLVESLQPSMQVNYAGRVAAARSVSRPPLRIEVLEQLDCLWGWMWYVADGLTRRAGITQPVAGGSRYTIVQDRAIVAGYSRIVDRQTVLYFKKLADHIAEHAELLFDRFGTPYDTALSIFVRLIEQLYAELGLSVRPFYLKVACPVCATTLLRTTDTGWVCDHYETSFVRADPPAQDDDWGEEHL